MKLALTRLSATVLAAVVLIAPAVLAAPATAGPLPSSPAASCAAIAAANPAATDGAYSITVFGKTLTVWCADLAGTPAEYLTLPNTGPEVNFSQYTGVADTYKTNFTKVRLILPTTAAESFAIGVTDRTFAVANPAFPLDYGFAAGDGFRSGRTNVNLLGTPFAIDQGDFKPAGWLGQGDIVVSEHNQVLKVDNGRGDNGGIAAISPLPLTWLEPLAVVSNPSDVTVNSGGDAVFTSTGMGAETVITQWQEPDGLGGWKDMPGATGDTLTIPAALFADSGRKFRAEFTTYQGTVVSTEAKLTVMPSLPRVTNLSGVTVLLGGSAVFSTTATGDPTPSLQWQRSTNGTDWADITGATAATLTLPGITLADDGAHVRVVASNSAGFAVSSSAVVTVAFISEQLPPTATAGSALDFTVTSPFATNFSVTSGALPAGLTLDQRTGRISGVPTATGTFSFTVTASDGSVDTAHTFTLTVDPASVVVAPAPTAPAAAVIRSNAPLAATGTDSNGILWVGIGAALLGTVLLAFRSRRKPLI